MKSSDESTLKRFVHAHRAQGSVSEYSLSMGDANDELMVVLVDDIHATIFRDTDRLRFGLS